MRLLDHKHFGYTMLFVGVTACFLFGISYAFMQNWHMTGLFPGRFRELSKDQRITLLRDVGMRTSPVRLRNILIAAYPNQPPEEHEQAHLIGETAYTQFGPKGFNLCDSAFTFACFHGVILAAIKTHGYNEGILKNLASECDASGKNDTAKVSCAHGIGHGIMWVRNYEFLASLELCDRLFGDTKLRFFCWDGVSMENVVRRAESAQKLPVVPWKVDNIYYPCDSIPPQYQAACAREHIFLLRLSVFERDTQKSIAYCLHFSSGDVHRECFGALGGALNQDDPTKPDTIIAECMKVPKPYDLHCIGRAAAHQAYSGDKNTAQNLCAAIVESQPRLECMQAVDKVEESRYMIQSL